MGKRNETGLSETTVSRNLVNVFSADVCTRIQLCTCFIKYMELLRYLFSY